MAGYRRWVLVTAALLSSVGCAQKRAQSLSDCISNEDCPRKNVCFFAKCVDPGYSIANVYFDIVPPAASGVRPQYDRASPRDLSVSLSQDVQLRPSVNVPGTLSRDAMPPPNGQLTATFNVPDVPALPSTQWPASAYVTNGAFTLTLVGDDYAIGFRPDSVHQLPPVGYGVVGLAAATPLNLDYPLDVMTVHGSLIASAMNVAPINDVRVQGVGNPDSATPLYSTAAITGSDGVPGAFTLVFPPGANTFRVVVTPAGNQAVPTAIFDNLTVVANGDGSYNFDSSIALEAPAERVQLAGIVTTSTGIAIADALVRFEASIGAGVYVVSATSDAAGNVSLADLMPGIYEVTVAPPAVHAGAGISIQQWCVPAAADPTGCVDGTAVSQQMEFIASEKTVLDGVLRDAANSPVVGARIVYRYRIGGLLRPFATNSDVGGVYTVAVDPGQDFEVFVEPPRESGLPRLRKYITLGDGNFDLVLYEASLVHGTILDPAGKPMSGVSIALYSTDLGTFEEPTLVSLTESNAAGEFVAPVPNLNGAN